MDIRIAIRDIGTRDPMEPDDFQDIDDLTKLLKKMEAKK